jgi:protein-S-isoprenylcysteine O-methyltransferase Ste14
MSTQECIYVAAGGLRQQHAGYAEYAQRVRRFIPGVF